MSKMTLAPDWITPLSDEELAQWIVRLEAFQRDPSVRLDRAFNVIALLDVLRVERRKRREESC